MNCLACIMQHFMKTIQTIYNLFMLSGIKMAGINWSLIEKSDI